MFFDHFKQTLNALPEVPDASKLTAYASLETTRAFFMPITPEEEAVAKRGAAVSVA